MTSMSFGLSATPKINKEERNRRIVPEGEIPSLIAPPPGCRFSTRCGKAKTCCFQDDPPMKEIAPGHFVKCHCY